jgi:hypothetical protein
VTVFLLKLCTAAQSTEAIRNLRRLLKYAKRSCGFLCIDAREEIPAQPDPDRRLPASKESES